MSRSPHNPDDTLPTLDYSTPADERPTTWQPAWNPPIECLILGLVPCIPVLPTIFCYIVGFEVLRYPGFTRSQRTVASIGMIAAAINLILSMLFLFAI